MSQYPVLKYTYFPILGRSFAPRLALKSAGIPFEFEKVSFEEWGTASADRSRFPLGDVPVLQVSGRVMAESIAQLVYIGKLTNLWPTGDALLEAKCIEILLTIEQVFTGITIGENDRNFIQSLQLAGDEQKKAREGPITDRFKIYFGRVEQLVGDNGFAIGDKISIVDLYLTGFVAFFGSGDVEHMDGKALLAPLVNIGKVAANVLASDKFKPIIDALLKE